MNPGGRGSCYRLGNRIVAFAAVSLDAVLRALCVSIAVLLVCAVTAHAEISSRNPDRRAELGNRRTRRRRDGRRRHRRDRLPQAR